MKELYESILSSTNAGKFSVIPKWINECIFLLDYSSSNNLLERRLVSYDRDTNVLKFDSIRHTSIHIIGQIPKGITIEIGDNWVIFDGCRNLDDCKVVSPNGNSHSTCIAVVNASFKSFEWQKGAPYVMIVHQCNIQSSQGFKSLAYACTGDNIKQLILPEQRAKNLYYYKYGNVLWKDDNKKMLLNFKMLCNACYSYGIGARFNPYFSDREKELAKKEFTSIGNAIYKDLKEYYDKPTIEIDIEPSSDYAYFVRMTLLRNENTNEEIVGRFLGVRYSFNNNKAYYGLYGGKLTVNAPFPVITDGHWPDKTEFVDKIVSYVKMDINRYKNTLS